MPQSAITGDVPKPDNVLVDLPAKRTFDRVVSLQQRREPAEFIFRQVARLFLRLDTRLVAKLA